jgi:hypothetical protein
MLPHRALVMKVWNLLMQANSFVCHDLLKHIGYYRYSLI